MDELFFGEEQDRGELNPDIIPEEQIGDDTEEYTEDDINNLLEGF